MRFTQLVLINNLDLSKGSMKGWYPLLRSRPKYSSVRRGAKS